LGAGQEESDAGYVETIGCKRVCSEGHDEEFEEFRPERDAAFAVFVGEVAAGNGENEEWNSEKQRDDENEPEIAAVFGESGVQDEETDEPLEGVVAERALELHGDERPEARETRRLERKSRVGFARRRKRHEAAEFSGSLDCGQAPD